MADNGTLTKTLFYNVTPQACVPAAIISIDASNCYDRIAHAIASLVFQAFGVPQLAIASILGAIVNMKFFLCTGFGESSKFAGGRGIIKIQGLTQGNGALPAGWAVISIVILNAHGKRVTARSSHAQSQNYHHNYWPSSTSTTPTFSISS
jgi:hypothetical protein